MTGPAEGGIQGNVTSSDEDDYCRTCEKTHGQRCAVIEKLETDKSVQEQYPRSSSYGGNMHGSESLF